jgi:hypothetical protein
MLLFMTLSAGLIIIVGGIKTALSGGGYGALNLMVENNSGLYEGSIISTFAIALIPIILWFARFGTIFPPDQAAAPAAAGRSPAPGPMARPRKGNLPGLMTKSFCGALVLACLLMPVGTEARTGLVCIGVLAILMLRDAKRRILYIAAAGLLGLVAIPFLPQSFTDRMGTIQGYQADQSANTRLAVWGWTLDYVQGKPFGGGFEAYLQNRIQVRTVAEQDLGAVQLVATRTEADEGRAWHSAYFEMLGEQGYPGLLLFLLIHGTGLVRMEVLRRRYRDRGDLAWVSPLATALQHFQIVYVRLDGDRSPDRLRPHRDPARARGTPPANPAGAPVRRRLKGTAPQSKRLSVGDEQQPRRPLLCRRHDARHHAKAPRALLAIFRCPRAAYHRARGDRPAECDRPASGL